MSDIDVIEVRGRLHGGGLRSTRDLARVELRLRGEELALPVVALGNQGGDLVVLLRDLVLERVLVVLLAHAAADGGLAILLSLPRFLVLAGIGEVVILAVLVGELCLHILALLASQLEVKLVGFVVLLCAHIGSVA